MFSVEQAIGQVPAPFVYSGGVQATDSFPYTAFQVCGVLQILVGLSSISVQIGDMVSALNSISDLLSPVYIRNSTSQCSLIVGRYCLDSDTAKLYKSYNPSLAGTGIWTGILFIIGGAIGASITRTRIKSRRCLRNSFMWMSILNDVLFAPALVIGAGIEWALVVPYRSGWEFALTLLVLGSVEFVLSLVSSYIGCCCSTIFYIPPQQQPLAVMGSPMPILQPAVNLGYTPPAPGTVVVGTIQQAPGVFQPHPGYLYPVPQQPAQPNRYTDPQRTQPSPQPEPCPSTPPSVYQRLRPGFTPAPQRPESGVYEEIPDTPATLATLSHGEYLTTDTYLHPLPTQRK